MKIIIEDKDLNEVKRVANDYYAIRLTNEQAKFFIEGSTRLAAELLQGGLDTLGREVLVECIIDYAMKDCDAPKSQRIFSSKTWDWPCNGDSDEFKREFDTEFKKAATNIGLELIPEVWK